MNSRKRTARNDAVSDEDIKKTIEYAENPDPPTSLGELQRDVLGWRREWDGPGLAPLRSIDDVKPSPKRVAQVLQAEDEITRRPMIFDKATGEVIEVGTRSIRCLNRLSLMLVDWRKVTREAEDWLRAQKSGRMMKGDGTIA
jgi:hypothetical protein